MDKVLMCACHTDDCPHELQRLGDWRSSVMVERCAHLAPDHLAKAANRLDALIGRYDLATLQKKAGSAEDAKPM
jgi:hypothetical protein